jgi:nicotinamide mononucleotide transporter
VPWSDAFTTALSIIAMWMLARKYAEQWLAWLVVDAVCVALYIYKGIYFYATLYAIYTVIAYIGYRKWLRMMK